jgi:Dehydrogenase E1 component
MAIQAKTAVPSAAANGKNGHSLISDAKFRQLYGLALRLQLLAQSGSGKKQRLTSMREHAAALAGVAADLHEGDTLLADHPSRIWDVLRVELKVGVTSPEGKAEQPLMTQPLIIDALSRATADRLRRNGRVSVLFFTGDAAQALIAEAHDLASAAKLPVLFVEEGVETAPKKQRAAAPVKNEMPAIPVDVHDVIAMYRVAHESIARAREGSGPTRIVCFEAPAVPGHTADAVADLERWLEARGLLAHDWRQEIVANAD